MKKSIKSLGYLSALSVFLILIRVFLKNSYEFTFLLWNLFLAWIPLGISEYLIRSNILSKKLSIIILFGLWLCFYPNSAYIITDLLHLKNYPDNILWFDSLLIFTFSLTGLLISFYSLLTLHLQFISLKRISKKHLWILIFIIQLFASFGIYLGRYCRLNSWHILKPQWLFYRIIHQFSNPLTYKLTLTYSFVLFAFYFVIFDFLDFSSPQSLSLLRDSEGKGLCKSKK